MNKSTAKTALKATGRGLGRAISAYCDLANERAEQERKEREIQEHIEALKVLKPGYDIVFTQRF